MRFRPLAVLAVTLAVCGGQADAEPRTGPSPFRETVVLDTDVGVIKQLAAVGDFIREGQFADAIEKLRQVRTANPETLVPVVFGRYVTVETYADLMLANLPPEGLAVYRAQIDPLARRWFEEGRDRGDEQSLRRVVREAFVSRYGDDALFLLGERAWDRGDPAAARDYWQQIIPLDAGSDPPPGEPLPVRRYPDTDLPRAEVLARLVLCSLLQGDRERAGRELAVFAKRHPDAEGTLAGREGKLVDILRSVAEAARQWPPFQPEGDVATFAGNPRRNDISAEPVDPGGVLWSVELPPSPLMPPSFRPALPQTRPLSVFPVVSGDTVYFNTAEHIYALDLHSGKAKEPVGRKTDDVLTRASLYDLPDPLPELRIRDQLAGVPAYTLTVAEGRIYARMGMPITGRAASSFIELPHRIVCLDPTEGWKTAWSITPGDLPDAAGERGADWFFDGSPVVADGRAFVAMRRSQPQTEARVVCLDAETGTLLWDRAVAASISNLSEWHHNVSHHLLTVAEDTVFFATGMGAIAALGAEDGRIRWVVSYETRPDDEFARSDMRAAALAPCVVDDGIVYAAPADSEHVLALAAESGAVRWSTRIPSERDRIRHLLGVTDDRVVLGGDFLWGLDRRGGAVIYPHGTPPRDPEEAGFGRGVIAGDVVYWPRRDRTEVYDVQTGEPTGRRVLQAGVPQRPRGGNLTIAGEILLVAEAGRLVAYGESARIIRDTKKWLSEHPDSAPGWLRLAQMEAAAGQPTDALAHFAKAAALARAEDRIDGQPVRDVALEQRFELLERFGQQAADARDFAIAADRFRKAAEAATGPAGRRRSWLRAADLETSAGDFPSAVDLYQHVLSDCAGGEATPERKAWTTARDRLAKLLDAHGRDLYAKYEQIARQRLDEAARSDDLEALRRVTAEFPLIATAPQTLHESARLLARRGQMHEALTIWRDLADGQAPRSLRVAALVGTAEALEDAGLTYAAADTWRELAKRFPDAPLGDDGRPALEAVPRRLAAAPYADARQLAAGGIRLPWRRAWQRARPAESVVLVPDGMPPGPQWDSVLLHTPGLECVDAATGQSRWSRPLSRRVTWAAYGSAHLLVATDRTLSAAALDTGRTLWSRPLAGADAEASENRPPQFRLVGSRLFVLTADRLTCHDADTGRVLWEHHPGGRLHGHWSADAEYVTLFELESSRRVVLDAESGRVIARKQTDGGPWRSDPLHLGGGRFAALDASRRPVAFDAAAASVWTYDGPLSFALAEPTLSFHGGALLLCLDGQTLYRLSEDSGEILWTRPLGLPPLTDAADQIAVGDDRLWTATGGFLRCVGLDGEPIWERVLTSRQAARARLHGTTLSVHTPTGLMFYDALTGDPLQQIHAPGDDWAITPLGHGLQIDETTISGWTGPSGASSLLTER